MEAGDQQARETKLLADMLALALDEQPGVSAAALAAIRHRARQTGVTGGALKEAFLRLRGGTGSVGDDGAAVAAARARARIEELQSQVVVAEQLRRQDLASIGGALRRARLAGLLAGLLAGGAGAVLARALL